MHAHRLPPHRRSIFLGLLAAGHAPQRLPDGKCDVVVDEAPEPSHNAALTPPGCRLRAALNCWPAVVTGMRGSWSGIAQFTTSAADVLGVVSVMNLKTPSSF